MRWSLTLVILIGATLPTWGSQVVDEDDIKTSDPKKVKIDASKDICENMVREGSKVPTVPRICSTIAPQNGMYKPLPRKTSPWKIYTWKPEIRQYYTHPITLGSDDGKEIFANYLLFAKSLATNDIVGHFEFQWDSIPVCCFPKDAAYHRSIEGHLQPNLLLGEEGRLVPRPNHTVLWTAPRHLEGKIVFVATFWKSSKLYWRNVTSSPVTVIKRV